MRSFQLAHTWSTSMNFFGVVSSVQPLSGTIRVQPKQIVPCTLFLQLAATPRSSFTGSTTLHEIYQYLRQQKPEANSSSYSIVSLHLGKEFADADQQRTLTELGVQSLTSLRLHYRQSPSGQNTA